MKRLGCIKLILFILLEICILHFMVGEGKTFILKKIYPVKYQEYVEMIANEYSLDKNLVYAVIKVESNFDSKAVSSAEAKGLMQLMDETAQDCNKKGKFGYDIPEDLFDAECNIRLGCYYLKELKSEFNSMKLAVTAYNGGVGNVRKWLKDSELSDGNGGIENIPYKETKDYVKKVFHTFEIYNRLYNGYP